jgi:hypothetical protein
LTGAKIRRFSNICKTFRFFFVGKFSNHPCRKPDWAGNQCLSLPIVYPICPNFLKTYFLSGLCTLDGRFQNTYHNQVIFK